MKLLIDISENIYTRLFDCGIQDNEIAVDDICEMARALRMGTPVYNDISAAFCGNNPKGCESCVSRGKCSSTRPEFQTQSLISRYQNDTMSGVLMARPNAKEIKEEDNGSISNV